MATLTAEQYDDSGLDFPESWIWDEHGERVSGTFVCFTRGHTKQYGPKTIVVLDVDGEQRSVWLSQTVVYNQFCDELRERPNHELTSGERITIKRGEKVESGEGSFYWKFRVAFRDKPPLNTGDLFHDLEPEPAEPEPAKAKPAKAAKSEPDEDGIPF